MRDAATLVAAQLEKSFAFVDRLLSGKDLQLIGKTVLALVAACWIGARISLLSLLYVLFLAMFAWPPTYTAFKHEIDDIYIHGKGWVEDKLASVPALIPKAAQAQGKKKD